MSEIAKLPPYHPLFGQGLTHDQICQNCKGWGKIFGLVGTKMECICTNGRPPYHGQQIEQLRNQR